MRIDKPYTHMVEQWNKHLEQVHAARARSDAEGMPSPEVPSREEWMNGFIFTLLEQAAGLNILPPQSTVPEGELTEEVVEASKAQLDHAIRAYYARVKPDAYISAWALLSHQETIELTRENNSMVGILVPTGQAFPMTRGMLHVAIDGQTVHTEP